MALRRILRSLIGCVVTLSLAITGTAAVLVATSPAARAAEVPWRCGAAALLFQSPNNQDPPHQVQSIDLVTGASTTIGTTADLVNAVAYNTADNFMYAWDLRTDTLVRISSDLTLTNLGVPTGTGTGFRGIDYNVGDFDGSGNLWILDNQTGRWLRIDMSNPNAPVTTASGIATAPANLILPGDWVFLNGLFYGVAPMSPATSTQPARLVSFNPATRTFTNRGILNGMISGSTFGAVYSDDAYLYVSRNQDGNIYRVDPATVTNTLLSAGPPSRSNDGARCRSNVIPTVTIVKQVGGRLVPDDQFDVSLIDASGSTAVGVTTTGTQTTVTSADQPVERGSTYVIADRLTDSSTSQATDYTGSLSCVTENGGVAASPPVVIATWSLTIGTANDYVCTVTNVPDTPGPELTLTKSVAPSDAGSFTAGEVLTYSFVVTNTGNVTVNDIAINEVAFSGAGATTTPTCPLTTLIPRASTTCSATYTVQAADVLAGTITNTAGSSGTDPGGNPVVSNDDSAEVPAAPAPSLAIEKSAFPPVIVTASEAVRYTFVVTNTGNVAVNNITVAEDAFNGTGTPISAPTCDRTSLLPGQRALCAATYTATQADVDRNTDLTNTAHADGTGPGGVPVVSPPDNASVPVFQNPQLDLVKTARTAGDRAGDVVTYRFTVTNSGNTTITALAIAEDAFSGSGTMSPVSCPTTTLTPAATTTCTATYAITADDIDTGSITNTARATGQDPQGGPVASDPSAAIIGFPQPLRVAPRITTRTSDSRVTPGQRFHDRVRLTRLTRGTQVTAIARLYGPFSSRAAARCRPASLTRTVTWRAGAGWSRSPAVHVDRAGIYTWHVTTKATSSNLAARHGCGQASETTTVARAAYQAPAVNGGYSGTLPDLRTGRAGSVVRAPGIGLRAPVLPVGVARGRMTLPASVGTVGWLSKSGRYSDKIGTAVIAGHVSDRHDHPGAMYRLSQAKRGQVVSITADNRIYRYKVTGKATFARGTKLPHRYFTTTGQPRLVLISCTDRVVYANRHFHYTRYQVVTAAPIVR